MKPYLMSSCQEMAIWARIQFVFAKSFVDLRNFPPLHLILYSTLAASILFFLIALIAKIGNGKKLPPGSRGLPVIGETLQFLRAHRAHKSKEWIEKKVAEYGPVFKTNLMGKPTVVLTGQAGNRFLLQNDWNSIVSMQPKSVSQIVGKTNILELSGEDHKRMRAALMQFLKPEALQKFVGKVDSAIRQHFVECWHGKEYITVWPLMKRLTFQSACELLFSLKDNQEREALREDLLTAMKGMWSLPLNLPGLKFGRSLKARSRICKRLSLLVEARRRDLQQGKASPRQDLLSSLLTVVDETNKPLMEEEIIDNIIALMIAGHDTTAVLLTHLVRTLALYPDIYDKVLQEQIKVSAGKHPDEPLTWEDIQKMKYSWRVAQETLRITPPLFGAFRRAVKDLDYAGYTIPKGWQLFWVTSSTHMDDEIFKNPTEFDPSRFESRIPPYCFTTFGGGTRICPGYDFTKMEILVFLHHLVTQYKWSAVMPDERIICDPVPFPAMGLPIKLEPNLYERQ